MEPAKQMKISRVNEWLSEFRRIGVTPEGGVTRLAYTDDEARARERFIELAVSQGLNVRIDGAGNVIARRKGLRDDLPVVACGSHLDTVVNGGAYDGSLGSLAALEVIARLNDMGKVTICPIEIIVFAAEESSRFGIATIGSKAMAGLIDMERLRDLSDNEGSTFEDALLSQELTFQRLTDAQRKPGELAAFMELHIEQGSVLETNHCPIGVVIGIAAPTRLRIEITGQAAHSGTTIMELRRDALLTGAELALIVEQMARQESSLCVGTVGVFNVFPNTANTIPGKVTMIVEFRSVDKAAKVKFLSEFMEHVICAEKRRGVQVHSTVLSDEAPTPLDRDMCNIIRDVCEEVGYHYVDISSGAGHDAMNIASLCPTGMIFVPSSKGRSHDVDEFTTPEDIDKGVDVLFRSILRLAETNPLG